MDYTCGLLAEALSQHIVGFVYDIPHILFIKYTYSYRLKYILYITLLNERPYLDTADDESKYFTVTSDCA